MSDERPATLLSVRDLVVRFAGFSFRFIDLAPAEQAELIARAQVAES